MAEGSRMRTSLTPLSLLHIFIAIILFVCLLRMPYWYYSVVTILTTVGMVIFLFDRVRKSGWTDLRVYFYAVTAVLLNPIARPSLGRRGWNTIDIVVGSILVLIVLIDATKSAAKQREE